MNHMQILKRAWSILWSYRALWVFGIILTLTAPRPGNNGDNNGVRFEQEGSDFPAPAEVVDAFNQFGEQIEEAFREGLSAELTRTLIIVGIIFVVVILLLSILAAILRYVALTALIKMVNQYEDTGEKVTWRQGFRMGWSRAAWRLFLTHLAVFLPVFLVFLVLFGCAAVPVLVSVIAGESPTWQGVVATIGLAFLVIFAAIIVGLALSLVMETVFRVTVLQNLGILEGIRYGWQLVRRKLFDVFVMWIILIGIQLGFFVVLIPVVILAGLLGAVVGLATGFGTYLAASALGGVTVGWVSAVAVGALFFFLFFIPPLAFVGGLLETYLATAWTLVYRALVAPQPEPLEPVLPQPTPQEAALPEALPDDKPKEPLA